MTKIKQEKAEKPKSTPVNIRLKAEERIKLEKMAQSSSRTLTQEIRFAILKHMEKR